MASMSYEEFKQEIQDHIKDFLPEKFEDSEVSIHAVTKNNEILDGLTVTSPDSNMAPTIYLNDFYEHYENGRDMDSIMEQIASIRTEHEMDQDFDISKITNFENVQDKIIPRIIGMEENEELLSNRPHAVMDDLAVIYAVDLGSNDNGAMSVPITNHLMENWNVSQETLHEAALTNMGELTPSTFKTMNEIMKEMMLPDMVEQMGGDREAAEAMIEAMIPDEERMYVLTNEQKLNGAAAILDDKMMDQIREKVGDEFFILPSSTHEVLIVPAEAGIELEALESMVQEVNATQVAPQDRLSDHVYQYDAETREVFRADRAEEHQQTKENATMPRDAVADQPKKEVDKLDKEKEKASLKERLEDKKKEVKNQEKKAPQKDLSKKKEASL